jgi:DNA replication and repair protein RecF
MKVNELYLEGFRNYGSATATFCDGVNVITGRNAQGKTNLIEAIYYLAAGRSFRCSSDKELVNFDRETACIRAGIFSGEREQTLEARFFRGRRRELYANEAKLKKATELTGRLTAVLFSPDDLTIIKDGAAVRRKLMDNCLSQLRPGYLAALIEFNRLYEHKTRILRDHHEKPSLLELLDDFDLRMAQQSARLIYYRSAFAQGLSKRAADIHMEFAGGAETLKIRYKTVGRMDAAGKKPQELLPELLEHQNQHRRAELSSGLCLSGAHKDDLEIEINGVAARKYSSQGQARTASVSIKLAERDIHHDDRASYPVLLLDDVLSELDSKRQSFILSRIKQGQVFITCCDDTAVGATYNGKTLQIENGKLKMEN